MQLAFLGATGTVTGSKYLMTVGGKQILVDCGLFQGFKQLRLRNWAALPFDARALDAVILTHAHLDHTGYLPLLVKNGFTGPVYCTQATSELCALLLPDSGHLQEEDAAYANRGGFSKHQPALPLYTEDDARRALLRLKPIAFERDVDLGAGVNFSFLPAGHILGAAMVKLHHAGTSILFTGDLGRANDLLMLPPTPVPRADYVVVESTYGSRRHDARDPRERLAEILNRTFERGGAVIVPAFAVGRAQTLLYYVHLLKSAKAIPDVPVFLNSPMAVNVTQIFHQHRGEHRLTPEQCDAMCAVATYVNSVDESKALNARKGPMIIVSASGMATGGRVLHHLKTFAPDARNTILFAGFQAGGTRGAAMLNGVEAVKIHGELVPVRAEVANISNLSAHADYVEILDWLGNFGSAPRQTFITHGEPAAADALCKHIEERFKWNVRVPNDQEQVMLTAELVEKISMS
ncbi:MAG: MBL fold metallo-hydrolase [Gammaproteobacteria bacterium]|nr:MBL fold metallo-hydrolase [Gammaproteobacteria bacterium]